MYVTYPLIKRYKYTSNAFKRVLTTEQSVENKPARCCHVIFAQIEMRWRDAREAEMNELHEHRRKSQVL